MSAATGPRNASSSSPRGDWRGARVTVLGLGRFGGGVGVARWLAERGASVTVTDRDPAEKLAESVAQLAGLPIRFHLGGHDLNHFRDADLVIVNPAVPDSAPPLAAAREAGVPLSTEINLFLERCPARIVGVTGSAGKSTTSSMLAAVLRATSGTKVWLGGNLGGSLLDELPRISCDDWVVLELSSFQLARTPLIRWSPHVAVLTNIAPNHLDWHGTFAHYFASKLNIVRFQDAARDHIVIGPDPQLRAAFDQMHGDCAGIWRYAADAQSFSAVQQSTAAVDSDDRRLAWPHFELRLPGLHNRINAAAALAVNAALGFDSEPAIAALREFRALEHRLELVSELEGVRYYDDSKATTPEAVATAIGSFENPLLIILGGYDKGADLSAMCELVARRARLAACIGQTGPKIAEQIARSGGRAEVCETLPRAVEACRAAARPGDAVLLSPGCASWGQFVDYRERGRLFRKLLNGDAPA